MNKLRIYSYQVLMHRRRVLIFLIITLTVISCFTASSAFLCFACGLLFGTFWMRWMNNEPLLRRKGPTLFSFLRWSFIKDALVIWE